MRYWETLYSRKVWPRLVLWVEEELQRILTFSCHTLFDSSMTDFTDPPTRGSSSTAFSKNGDSSIVCSIYSFYLILIHDLLLFSASYSEMRHCCRTANIVLNSVSGPRFAPFPVTDWQCEELHDKRSDSGVLNRTSEASLHWQLAKPAQCTNTQRLTSPCNIQKELQASKCWRFKTVNGKLSTPFQL